MERRKIKLQKKLLFLKEKGSDTSKVLKLIAIENLRSKWCKKAIEVHVKYRRLFKHATDQEKKDLKVQYKAELQQLQEWYEDQYSKYKNVAFSDWGRDPGY